MTVGPLHERSMFWADDGHFVLRLEVNRLRVVIFLAVNLAGLCNEPIASRFAFVPAPAENAAHPATLPVHMVIGGLPKLAMNRADDTDLRMSVLIANLCIVVSVTMHMP
jgi:hypothetical protein